MYQETLQLIAGSAHNKSRLFKTNFFAYLLHAAMAGIYLGFGVVLVFSLTTPLFNVDSPVTSLVMGTTFGIALSLVMIAGADLFTGNTMIMVVGALERKTTVADLIKIWLFSYLGNFLGAVFFAILAWQSGVIHDAGWLLTVANKKMQASFHTLFFRGLLCNWLVVLAIWCSFRLKTEAAKLIMVWWCLLGFVGSGYEHSIANMVLLTLANLLPHDPLLPVSWQGMWHNLLPVTLGNLVSGVCFMALPYYMVSAFKSAPKQELHNY